VTENAIYKGRHGILSQAGSRKRVVCSRSSRQVQCRQSSVVAENERSSPSSVHIYRPSQSIHIYMSSRKNSREMQCRKCENPWHMSPPEKAGVRAAMEARVYIREAGREAESSSGANPETEQPPEHRNS